MTKQFEISDLSETDKIAARKHIAWMQNEIGVASIVVRLPFLGQVTITVNGSIFKKIHD